MRYDGLDSATVEKFSEIMLPIYQAGDPVVPGN